MAKLSHEQAHDFVLLIEDMRANHNFTNVEDIAEALNLSRQTVKRVQGVYYNNTEHVSVFLRDNYMRIVKVINNHKEGITPDDFWMEITTSKGKGREQW